MGQIGKELEFKSLLGQFICFFHRFFTEAVEKVWDEFLSPESSLDVKLSHGFESRPERRERLRLFTCL